MGDDDGDSNACQLKLSKTEAYLHGPIPRDCLTYNTSDELFSASQAFKNAVASWKATPVKQVPVLSVFLPPIGACSSGGAVVIGTLYCCCWWWYLVVLFLIHHPPSSTILPHPPIFSHGCFSHMLRGFKN